MFDAIIPEGYSINGKFVPLAKLGTQAAWVPPLPKLQRWASQPEGADAMLPTQLSVLRAGLSAAVDLADRRLARQLDHPAPCGTCCASSVAALQWF